MAEYGVISGVLGSLRPAVVALIASAGISILITAFWGNDMITFAGTNWGLVTIFIICIFLIQKVKMNPVWVCCWRGDESWRELCSTLVGILFIPK